MALLVNEPDVTLMRLPFYNIWIYVTVSYAKVAVFLIWRSYMYLNDLIERVRSNIFLNASLFLCINQFYLYLKISC